MQQNNRPNEKAFLNTIKEAIACNIKNNCKASSELFRHNLL